MLWGERRDVSLCRGDLSTVIRSESTGVRAVFGNDTK